MNSLLAIHTAIASKLISLSIDEMKKRFFASVYLDALTTNVSALNMYERLGFMRTKYLRSFYQTDEDAYRLKRYLHVEYPPDTHLEQPHVE